MVLRGLTTIWSLATLPTRRSPLSLIATTLGRISDPLSLGTTRATLLRTYATHVFVVPRSMPRRMDLSAGMKLGRCYGGGCPGRNKSPCFHPTGYRTITPAGLESTTSGNPLLPPFPTVRRRAPRPCRSAPAIALLWKHFRVGRQLDAPLLVRRRRRGQLVEKSAGPQEQPRLVALLLHHWIRQVQLVLRPRHRHVEEPPLLFLA